LKASFHQLPKPAPATPVPVPATPAVPSTTGGGAKLILKRGGAPTGDVFSIGASATVGRFDPESGPVDVDMAQLPEAVYISRHHAEINLRDGQWMVKDLGSRNGTFVKNAAGFTRVTGETPVTNGDEIAFGNARFEFQIA
jgi:pSer/pThr/pTyr-binding forkhead associated (FHA) protein